MDMTVREKLNEGKLGKVIAVAFTVVAVGALIYLLWPAKRAVDPLTLFYSDDDGQSYFRDSVYKFTPWDDGGKTAYEAFVVLDHGSKVVGYLVRYTPQALKTLTDRYNDDLANHMSAREIQHDILTLKHAPNIYFGEECKLPGAGNKWIPRGSFSAAMIKTPSGDPTEGEVLP